MTSRTWRDLVSRSTLAPDAFYVHEECVSQVLDLMESLGVPHQTKISMYNPSYSGWAFLDGGVGRIDPYGFFGPRGTRIYGTLALRYVLHQLDVWPPKRRLKGETVMPTAAQLSAAFEEERDRTVEGAQEALDAFFTHAFGSAMKDWYTKT